MNRTVSSNRVYHTKTVLLSILILCLLLSGCAASKQNDPVSQPLPSSLEQSATNKPESSNDTVKKDTLPRTVEYEYVIVQDYADNEVSRSVLSDFGEACNKELSMKERADYHLRNFGKDLFLINAAAPFEEGVLICGHVMMGGEDYCKLYYLENGDINYSAEDSDIWSLNYTVFRDHTIAYGKALGWDNGIFTQKKVVARFANNQTISQNFSNIPFESKKDGGRDEEVVTAGYILIADGQTWVKNIEFYGQDGGVEDNWQSDQFIFGPSCIWKNQPNEIWTTYRYTEMLSRNDISIMNEITPIIIKVNCIKVETQSFLVNEQIGLEYIWRNNNHYHSVVEIKDVSEIKIEGLDDDDEVLWIALDQDKGTELTNFAVLRLHNPPQEKGNYCLLIKHDGNLVLKNQNMYYSVFIRIV